MSKKKVKINVSKKKPEREARERKEPTGLLDLPEEFAGRAREIWLAGLGALSAVEEEGSKLFNRLVAKGEAWEKSNQERMAEARKKADAAAETARETAEEARDKVAGKVEAVSEKTEARLEELVNEAVTSVLHRVGAPTRPEIQALSEQVERLTREVAALADRLERGEAGQTS